MTIDHDNPFERRWVNLAQPRLGAEVVAVTDEFFAPAQRLLRPEPPVFIADRFDEHGKWMDGWETRRRRRGGHDHCVVRLGRAGVIHGIEVDTRHFTGNFPAAASLEACRVDAGDPEPGTAWTELIAAFDLEGDTRRWVEVDDDRVWTHVRLHIYPDGGIARLRVHGSIPPGACEPRDDGLVDLTALENGGRIIAFNDAHFGTPENLISPGRGVNMGDGWETRRRREPGHDWVIIALGEAGVVREVEVDTAFFKGNYPDRCAVQAARVIGVTENTLVNASLFWDTLLPEQPLTPDAVHRFASELEDIGPVTHIKFNIMPDGGISRLRLWGRPG